MFRQHLYNWLWENMRERMSHESDYGLIDAAMRRPPNGDEPRTFLEFVRCLLGR
jgi:hypothetical protein